ncbi:MAG TPA: 4-(cytidine 5'-diphospho)-2-C-methyl-D-erythritol kinase [Clostridia bacterium]|nr:4-(cytidine 5'-diphospho)-2-C-methyl-D-erythritol kinase [Clostridia bacterium]
MKYYQSEARAKINLSIDVLRKRPDGYHDVKMIMQSVRLHDDVTIEKKSSGIEISCQFPWVPNDRRNTAYKAAEIIMEKFRINDGVKIVINKNIPVAAGLAGGSSDAASVILGMNELFSLGMNDDQLAEIGKSVGADVPYCIRGGTVLAEGIGDILTNLNQLPCVNLVLIKPKINVSTPWVYKSLNLEKIKNRPDTEALIKAIADKRVDFISKNMVNVLETVTIEKYPFIDEIKRGLVKAGALGSIMSGSGPTVFGVFECREAAQEAFNSLKDDRWESILTETC